ncbi:hypothetical protein [Candidatus Pantoea multigeneris]|nr:hypothetical protein [Pantoea multigeneris]
MQAFIMSEPIPTDPPPIPEPLPHPQPTPQPDGPEPELPPILVPPPYR